MVDCPDDVKKIVFANAKDRSGCFLHRPLAIDLHIAEQCASWREGLINTHYKQIFVWVSILNHYGYLTAADRKPVARKPRQHGHEPSPEERGPGQKRR